MIEQIVTTFNKTYWLDRHEKLSEYNYIFKKNLNNYVIKT